MMPGHTATNIEKRKSTFLEMNKEGVVDRIVPLHGVVSVILCAVR